MGAWFGWVNGNERGGRRIVGPSLVLHHFGVADADDAATDAVAGGGDGFEIVLLGVDDDRAADD